MVPPSLQVCGDATVLFPLIVSQTFYKHWQRQQQQDDGS
jgi:deoxyhypusine synthase